MKVSVCITTYNHENYIAQAIESVLSQCVNFEYEIIIGEDQSSDNTREIVLSYRDKYPDLIKLLIHNYPDDYVRTNGRKNFITNIYNASGDYIALLDGDDYWADNHKLQKQVDFLDHNPELSAVFHWVDWLENDIISSKAYGPLTVKESFSVDDLLRCSNFIPTCSVMFRRPEPLILPEWYFHCPYGDLPLHMISAIRGRIGFIDESMAVYRVHSNGLYSSRSEINRHINNLYAMEMIAVSLNLNNSSSFHEYISAKLKEISDLIDNKNICAEAAELISSFSYMPSNFVATHCLHAEIFQSLGKLDKANDILIELIKLPNPEADVFHILAVLQLKLRNWKLAIQYYNEELNSDSHYSIANRYDRLFEILNDPEKLISVIICTYNRSELLVLTIQSLLNQCIPEHKYEIIVVDNNSSDNTRKCVETLISTSPVRLCYIFEGRQGLSYARNTGINHASGDIIAFTDDDVDAEPMWLAEIVAAFDSSDIACVGGPLRPVWLAERPEWLNDNLLPYLAVSDFERVKTIGYFSYPDYPWGANIAFRRTVFAEIGLFSVNLGRTGGKLLSNEEIEICYKIQTSGYRIKFAPRAIINHKMQPNRLNKQWFFHRTYHQGCSDAILDIVSGREINKLEELCTTGIWSYLNPESRSVDVRCFRKSILGYLNEILLSDSCSPRRRIRQLNAYISQQLSLLTAQITQRNLLETECAIKDYHLKEKDKLIAIREEEIAGRVSQVESLQQICQSRIDEMQNSLSWRITKPLRWLGDKVRGIAGSK